MQYMREIVSNKMIEGLFGKEFELIEDGPFTGDYNMKFDFDRTMLVSDGKALPMFRLYGWNPWSVSLGYNQKETDIDKDKCKEYGFDIVRRPTGGRAVLHANELTYSVVLKLPNGMTVHDAYRDIHIILLSGLKKLGCPQLGFEQAQPDFKNLYGKQDGLSVSCFASSARWEIEWKGKKVIGSAQRLFGNTLLQHGSILLGPGHELLAEVASLDDEIKRKRLKDFTLDHSATLSEACDRMIDYKESANSIIDILKAS
jgi:lipoate-protein ligase A